MSGQGSRQEPDGLTSGAVPSRWFIIGAVILAAILALVLFAMAVTGWREFRLPDDMNIDLAWANQAYYRSVHGHGWLQSTVSEMGSRLLLGVHFSPTYFLLLPFYPLWQSPLLLLLVSAFGVATLGVTVMLVARRIFGSTVLALIWFGIFAFYPSIPLSIQVDGFRELYLAMGFLSLALLFYIEQQYWLFFVMVFLGVLSKEDIALLLPVWGAVAWLQRRDWRLAGAIVLLGIVVFIVANTVALPLLRGLPLGRTAFVGFGSPLGETPGALLHSLWSDPGGVVSFLVRGDSLGFWVPFLSPLLFLPVLGWEYLMIPAYLYFEIALRPRPIQIPIRYLGPAFPFIFVAAMVGAQRLVAFVGKIWHLPPARAAWGRNVVTGMLMCALAAATFHFEVGGRTVIPGTPFPRLLAENWPTSPGLSQNAALLQALSRIPPQASVAATLSLISQISSRDAMYFLGIGGPYFEQAMDQNPDYAAVALEDLDDRRIRLLAALLCQGIYGVVYEDNLASGRMLLERGAGLSANHAVYERYLPGPHQPCPALVQQVMSPREFRRAASIHARTVPSAIRAEAMFPEPVQGLSSTRFAQVIHLPDHTFEPGWYRMDLTGAWPWPWVPAAARMTVRVVAGERVVGAVTVGSDQPLLYATPPFRIDRRETRPVRVEADVRIPEGEAGQTRALRPVRGGCAIVADAPSLNPQQVTVEAVLYLAGVPAPAGGEVELPILSKNNAAGYYLRLSGDAQGKVWVDFNVAGKWALGQAVVGAVPLHQWAAVAATYDGEEARIYINGHQAPQEVSRSARYAGPIRSQGAPLVIGCRDPGRPSEVVFRGLIASARVWDRVLTPQEIQEEAAQGVLPAGTSRGLVGSWGFQTVDGSVIADRSGVGNPITNGGQLTRVPVPQIKQPVAAWRSRELNVLRLVTISGVPSAHVREQFPSELGPEAMFPEPVTDLSDARFAQVIHLPDHTFEPGWYRMDLTGTWPLPWVPASYQMKVRVVVGERVVGAVTAGGDQPLRYATPPVRIDRRETQPVRVEVDVRIPEGEAGQTRALRPARGGCAIVADAPSLNPQQVTVEGLVYLAGVPAHVSGEVELPILSKNNAGGYYLRLVGDAQGKVWVDFNVAGKWTLGRADVGAVPLRQWAAVAATYDGQEARIYINGYRAAQDPFRSPRYAGPIRSQGAPLVIGCRDPGQPYEVVFPGLIASARVWDRVLTVQEIQEAEVTWALPAGDVRGLVGSWGFQSAEGGDIPDLSGGAHVITNARQLTRAPMPGIKRPFAAWRSRNLNLLRTVTVRFVKP